MIRFVDLGKQIAVDENDPEYLPDFCFYDTISACFITFSGQQIFNSHEDLLEQMEDEDPAYMKRILGLIPNWVPRGKPTINR